MVISLTVRHASTGTQHLVAHGARSSWEASVLICVFMIDVRSFGCTAREIVAGGRGCPAGQGNAQRRSIPLSQQWERVCGRASSSHNEPVAHV